jgi:hypothetical protein
VVQTLKSEFGLGHPAGCVRVVLTQEQIDLILERADDFLLIGFFLKGVFQGEQWLANPHQRSYLMKYRLRVCPHNGFDFPYLYFITKAREKHKFNFYVIYAFFPDDLILAEAVRKKIPHSHYCIDIMNSMLKESFSAMCSTFHLTGEHIPEAWVRRMEYHGKRGSLTFSIKKSRLDSVDENNDKENQCSVDVPHSRRIFQGAVPTDLVSNNNNKIKGLIVFEMDLRSILDGVAASFAGMSNCEADSHLKSKK